MSWRKALLSLVIPALVLPLHGQTKPRGQQASAHDSSWYVVRQYYDTTQRILQRIMGQERQQLEKASDLMAQSVREGRLIHVFGTGGHNIMAAMEIFKRAGSLVPINPLFPPGLSVADAHPATERLLGYAEKVLLHYNVQKGDVILIINCNGVNSVTIEAAVQSKKMGLTVIAVTSREFSRGIPAGTLPRHPSNQNLCDLGDIVIDSHVPLGDAVVKVDDFAQEVSAISTMANTFIVQSLIALTGVSPLFWHALRSPSAGRWFPSTALTSVPSKACWQATYVVEKRCTDL